MQEVLNRYYRQNEQRVMSQVQNDLMFVGMSDDVCDGCVQTERHLNEHQASPQTPQSLVTPPTDT